MQSKLAKLTDVTWPYHLLLNHVARADAPKSVQGYLGTR